MLTFQVKNYDLSNAEKTSLTAALAIGETSLPTQSVVGFAANDFVVAGNYCSEGAQLRKIDSITSPNIVLTAALTAALSSGDSVIKLQFDKVILQESTDGISGWADVATFDLDVDSETTEVSYASASTAKFYRTYFKNSETNAVSEFSGAIPGSGATEGTLGWFKEACARGIKDPKYLSVLPEDWSEHIKSALRLLFPTVYKPVTKDVSSSASTYSYDFPAGIDWVDRVYIVGSNGKPAEYSGARIFNSACKFECDIGSGYTIRLEGRTYFTSPTGDADSLGVQKMHYELLIWEAQAEALQAMLLDKTKMNQYAAEVKGVTETDVMNTIALLSRKIDGRRGEVSAPIQAYDMISPTAG